MFTENNEFAYLLTLMDVHVYWTTYIFKPTDRRYDAETYHDWECHFKDIQFMNLTLETLTGIARSIWPGTKLQITQKSASRVILRVHNKVLWDLTGPRPLWVLHTLLTALKFAH